MALCGVPCRCHNISFVSNCLALNLKGCAGVIKQHFTMSIMEAFLKPRLCLDKAEKIFFETSQCWAFRNATEISEA